MLFVGNIGQAKGISYLVDAMRKVTAPCTLTLLGRPTAMPPILQEAFCLHRWIDTVPHGQVIEIMRSHDVLVLPTLFEGRALVALEALSQGLPVITTPNSGNEDVVQDGISGFIVPIRSSDAIAARLTQLSEDRDLLATMSEQARRIASECSWKRYRARLLSILNDFLATR